jgi:hypothetical protein
VRLFTIGRSEAGRDILMLAVADEAGIRELDRLKAATSALADPGPSIGDERLIAGARPIYYFNAVLHSDETGSTEAMLELAYRLAVSEQPMIQRIRRELVVLVNPVSNPDGRDRVVEWYYRFLKGRTDWATLPRQSPPYWSNYAFVDINRVTHQQTHEATKAVHRMFHEWHPTVVHDLHEAFALMLTWNGTGPYNPNIDPITYGEFLEMSFHEVRELTALGMPGVWTWKFGEGFGHHYLDSVAMNHNSVGRGYETWGNTTPERVRRELRPSQVTTEWYRPLPPPREFSWSARDNLNYTETGALSALDYMAGNAKAMLRNFYQKGWNSLRKGVTEAPFAFIIPEDQGDRARVAQLVERLLGQRIEVSRAVVPITLGARRFEAGSYVVRLDQPYRTTRSTCSSRSATRRTAARPTTTSPGRCRPTTGSRPSRSRTPRCRACPRARSRRCASPCTQRARADGDGPGFLLRDTGQEALLAALPAVRLRGAGRFARVRGRGSGVARGQLVPSGARRAEGRGARRRRRAGPRLRERRLRAERSPRRRAACPSVSRAVGRHRLDRLIRCALDQRRVPYVYLRDEDVRAGRLRSGRGALRPGRPGARGADQGLRRSGGRCRTRRRRRRRATACRRVGRHHGRHRLRGSREPEALRGGRRPAGDARQRQPARARGGLVRGVSAPRAPRAPAPRTAPGRGPPARTCGSASSARTIRWRMAIRRAPTSSAKTSRSTTRRGAGCGWPIAPPASTAPWTRAASCSNGATAKARRSW